MRVMESTIDGIRVEEGYTIAGNVVTTLVDGWVGVGRIFVLDLLSVFFAFENALSRWDMEGLVIRLQVLMLRSLLHTPPVPVWSLDHQRPSGS